MKYAFVKECRTWSGLSLSRLLALTQASRSGYYDWFKYRPSRWTLETRELDQQIREVFEDHQGRYGHRRIHVELLEAGLFQGSRERIRRRMKQLGLKGHQGSKFKRTTDSNHDRPVAENLLNQDFSVTGPDQAWVGDITYIRLGQKWLYLAVVIDLFSRRVIGWAMCRRMNAELVCDALEMVLFNRGYPKDVIVHSDRGSQYCSRKYQKLIRDNGLKCSMSGKGNCYDNAVCESFFHTMKVELIYQRNYQTEDQARRSIFWYIEAYYNRIRRHSGINYQSPVNYENQAEESA